MEKTYTYRVIFFDAEDGDILERENFKIDEFGNLADKVEYHIAQNFNDDWDIDYDYDLIDIC